MTAPGSKTALDNREGREKGSALAIAGWLVLLANLIVLFYVPAAAKLGRQRPYEWAIAFLVVLGVVMITIGRSMRRHSS